MQENNPRSLFFRSRLVALIAERGISQRELAAATRLTPQSVSNYVRGTRSLPGAEELLALAQYFEISMESLLGPDDPQGTTKKGENVSGLSPSRAKLRRIAEQMERTCDALKSQAEDLKKIVD